MWASLGPDLGLFGWRSWCARPLVTCIQSQLLHLDGFFTAGRIVTQELPTRRGLAPVSLPAQVTWSRVAGARTWAESILLDDETSKQHIGVSEQPESGSQPEEELK